MEKKLSQEEKYKRAMMVFALIIALPFGAVLAGFTISKLWLWFLVPIGLPVISIPQAIGIDILFSFLASKSHNHDEREFSEKMGQAFSGLLIAPLFILFIGYIVTIFL